MSGSMAAGAASRGKHIGSVTEARTTDVELRMSDGAAISNPMTESSSYVYED